MLRKLFLCLSLTGLFACQPQESGESRPLKKAKKSAAAEIEKKSERVTEVAPAVQDAPVGDTQKPAKSTDEKAVPTPPTPAKGLSFRSASTTSKAGKSPLKGEPIVIQLDLQNPDAQDAVLTIRPLLTSKRFSDYKNVRLTPQTVTVPAQQDLTLSFALNPLFREDAGTKEYALGAGDYEVKFEVEQAGQEKKTVTDIPGKDFHVGANAIALTAVFHSSSDTAPSNAMEWLAKIFGDKYEIFTPRTEGSEDGTYKAVEGNFESVLGFTHLAKAFPGITLKKSDFDPRPIISEFGTKALGLPKAMDLTPASPDLHGYDLVYVSAPSYRESNSAGNMMVLGPNAGYTTAEAVAWFLGAEFQKTPPGFMMHAPQIHDHFKNSKTYVWHSTTVDRLRLKVQEKLKMFHP